MLGNFCFDAKPGKSASTSKYPLPPGLSRINLFAEAGLRLKHKAVLAASSGIIMVVILCIITGN